MSFEAVRFEGENPVSAVMTPIHCGMRNAAPSSATARLEITESQAAQLGLSDEWQIAYRRKAAREQRENRVLIALETTLKELSEFAAAQDKPLSQRKLAKALGIPERTFRRIKDRKVDLFAWTPKLRAAAKELIARQNSTP